MGVPHSHLAHWTRCMVTGIACNSLYREILRHCAYTVGPLCCHCAYALPVHHIVQADGPRLQTQTNAEECALLLVHQEP